MSTLPRACVLNASGINCNDETGTAFEMAGAQVEQVHISQLKSGDRRLDDFQILALPGGFSYGDDVASGKVLAIELTTQLGEEINDFVERKRGLVIGICNGFQVLVKSGLLPGGRIGSAQTVTLTDNSSGSFECRWVNLKVEDSVCGFTADCPPVISLPVANGEGRYVSADAATRESLRRKGQIVLRYADAEGQPTDEFPYNPSGSEGALAGLSDESGLIFGLMPHIERFVRREQHPNWRRQPDMQPAGLPIVKSMVRRAIES